MGALELIRLWVAIKPFKRLRERREAKRAARIAENQVSENVPVEAAPTAEDDPMTQEIVTLLIRHGLTFVGGAGLLTGDEYAQLAGAVATIAGLSWSAYRKWQRSKTVAA